MPQRAPAHPGRLAPVGAPGERELAPRGHLCVRRRVVPIRLEELGQELALGARRRVRAKNGINQCDARAAARFDDGERAAPRLRAPRAPRVLARRERPAPPLYRSERPCDGARAPPQRTGSTRSGLAALPVTFAHGALTPRGYGPAARLRWTPGAAVSTRSVACGAPVGERTAHRAQRRSVRASAAQELRG